MAMNMEETAAVAKPKHGNIALKIQATLLVLYGFSTVAFLIVGLAFGIITQGATPPTWVTVWGVITLVPLVVAGVVMLGIALFICSKRTIGWLLRIWGRDQ